MKRFKNLNITATEQDIDEFVAIDTESTHMFQEEILEEANFFFEEQQISKWRWELQMSDNGCLLV